MADPNENRGIVYIKGFINGAIFGGAVITLIRLMRGKKKKKSNNKKNSK